MLTDNKLTGFADFEHIMINIANDRGWEFKFGEEFVPVQNVFNHSTYAPALLAAANSELETRHIAGDLAIEVKGESNSIFGARVLFDENRNSLLSQMWRLVTASMIVESLPKNGNYIMLDQLQYVFGDRFAVFIETDQLLKDVE